MIWLRIALMLAPLLIGGLGAWWVNDRAYNRGHAAGWADNTAAQKKAAAIKKEVAVKGREELNRLPPEKIDAEIIKRCKAACGEDRLCQAACD